jgi:hypothetical protein
MLHGLIGLAAASMFTRVTGIGDGDQTFYAWIAWRILGALTGVASTYLMPQLDGFTGIIAAFALATVAIDVARKVTGLMSSK